MAKELAEWKVVDADNNFAVPDGWPEGMPRSEVNDVGRANMGVVRRWYDDAEWLDLTVGAGVNKIDSVSIKVLGGDFTSYFTGNRRIKLTGGAVDPFYAHVDNAVTNAGDTDVSLTEPSDLSGVPDESGTFAVSLHIGGTLRSSAFTGSVTFSEVAVLTGVAIQSAIDSLEDTGGGTIILTSGATYIVDAQINIGLGTSNGDIQILGRHATLQADVGLDDSILSIDGRDVHLDNLFFDGNRSNQAGTADAGTLELLAGATDVILDNCEFINSYAHHIKAISGNKRMWFTACIMDDSGEDGIKIVDPTSSVEDVYIRDCRISNPAAQASITEGACINIAGPGYIWGCTLNGLNHATDVQIGIAVAEKQAASPSDQSGHGIAITACSFLGTGDNAMGVQLQGRDCSVVSCLADLPGASSVGVDVKQPRVADVSDGHVISSNRFLNCGAQGVNLQDDTEDITVIGNVCKDCDTGIRSDGDHITISGNAISDGVTAVSIQGNSDSPIVTGNTMESQSGDAVVVASGAASTSIGGNTIMNAGSDGVAIASGATSTFVNGNTITDSVGEAVNDSGTGTVLNDNVGITTYASSKLSTPLSTTNTSEALLHDSLKILAPETADGTRKFLVSGAVNFDKSTLQELIYRLRMGTNSGTPTSDTLLWQGRIEEDGSNLAATVSVADFEITPASGDEIYWTNDSDSSSAVIIGDGAGGADGPAHISIKQVPL